VVRNTAVGFSGSAPSGAWFESICCTLTSPHFVEVPCACDDIEASLCVRLEYDPQVDAAYIRFHAAKISTTNEIVPGVMLDLAEDGRPVGLELLNVSARSRASK
jgi:uncharacterized protein YuzE